MALYRKVKSNQCNNWDTIQILINVWYYNSQWFKSADFKEVATESVTQNSESHWDIEMEKSVTIGIFE